MSNTEPNGFDYAAFEAEFQIGPHTHERRAEALGLITGLWDKMRPIDDVMPVARRFIIAGGANQSVPAGHERMLLIPKPWANPIAKASGVRVSVPYLPAPHGSERRLDPRFALFEFKIKNNGVLRALLSETEFSVYGSAHEVSITSLDDEVMYEVPQDATTQAALGSLGLAGMRPDTAMPAGGNAETTALATVATLLTQYEPTLQDNRPLFKS